MDAVTLALAKKHTNEQVIQKATNSPTETISFDCGAYSLPSTVVNGQVSDVVLKGNTYTNIVKNGNFADGTLNWITTASNLTVDGNTAIVTGNGSSVYPRISQSNITSYGEQKKIYVRARVKVNNSSCNLIKIELLSSGMSTVEITLNTPTENTWYTHSGIISLPPGGNAQNNVSIQIAQRYSDVDTANGKVMEVQEVVAIDMGTSGSELYNLTTAQMNQRFPYYFNSTKSTNSVRVKSVGKNLFDGRLELGAIANATGLNVSGTDRVRSIGYVRVEPDTKYSTNLVSAAISYVHFYDIDKNHLKYIVASAVRSFVTPSNCSYIRFTDAQTDILKQIQVELGDTATEYEPYKESIVNVNLPEPLRSLPNGVKDEVSVVEGKRTQNVKEYVLQASDIDRVGNYAPNYTIDIGLDALQGIIPQTPEKMKTVSIAGMTEINGSSGAVSWVDGVFGTNSTQLRIGSTTITTLEQAREQFTGLAVTYQLAEPIVTKLPAQPPLQIYENGTVYVEPIGDASESTLPSVEMTIPTGTSNKFGVATHNYGGAAADWVLTNSESKCFLLAVSNAGGAANIIAPNRPGTMYAISNASGHTITIKISGGNGVKVTNAKTVLVIHNGTDYVALTAEL